MKVLHIWDVAGVANIIAKFMDRSYGTKSHVITRKAFDPFGLNIYTKPINSGAKTFAFRAIFKARNYDIIHVHSLDKIVPYLKLLYNKPVVLGYYGSDIRNKWNKRCKFWIKADAITYSTLDLATEETPKKAIWIPCPIDTELFSPQKNIKATNTAVSFEYGASELAEQYAKKYGITLTVAHRKIPYLKMPNFLAQYEFYMDIKKVEGEIVKTLSKTGLEALACGLKVIRWDGQIETKFPEENRPENTVKKLYELYRDLLKK